jgi:ABC-2 type transport system ATP-binding protein
MIAVEGLTKRYGELVAVDDVSFEVQPGELFVLLGPNGAGKTTTVEILEGLRKADEGRATVLGEAAGARSIAPHVGVMPQESDLYAGIKTEEALRLFASFYDEHEDPDALLRRFDLERARKTSYRRLSGGEKRRLSLAIAVVGRPKVAFLDEPTAGMDVEGRAATWSVVDELKQRGTTILLTTHLLDEAERVADRVGILHRGKLVALGPPGELTSGRKDQLTITVASDLDADALSAAVGARVARAAKGVYRIANMPPTPRLVSDVTKWLASRDILLRRIEVGPRSLEEFYLEVTAR